MRRGSWVLILGLLLTSSACAHGGGAARPTDSAIRLQVTNHYSLPMEVYVAGSGINHRLGTVLPGMVSWFVLPEATVGNGPVEFQAHPTADARALARSGELLLAHGQVVQFVIATPLFNSTATVQP